MNEMFDNIMCEANIPPPDVPSVDLFSCQDFSAMSEMLLGKLSAIEKSCETAAASTQKKYDARTIRDKIALKRRQLAELERENAALEETVKRQERALREVNRSSEDLNEAKGNVVRLRQQLAAVQKEIKLLEDQRHVALAENRRLKGQLQATQRASKEIPAPRADATEEELTQTIEQLQKKQHELEEKRQKEYSVYQGRIQALQHQKEDLLQEKAALEQRIKDKQKELELIHSTAAKSRFPAPLQLRRK
jgi:chromosome segregation ATPase